MSDSGSSVTTRDEAGHFLPGTSGNPKGRPPGRRAQIDILKQDLEIAVRSKLDARRIGRIVEKMCDLAENGDVKAAKLILSMSVSTAASTGDEGDKQGGITIRIENATFAATAANKEKPVEGRVIEQEKNPNGD